MELYKIIAYIGNTSTTFQLAYLPENFEGIKINQNFSFVNPIGFNPKFSVDTMRIVSTDKTAIDTAFDTYGLQTRVVFDISKLNASGIGYTSIGTSFEIDFESYEKFDEYSEFALKSVSAFDFFNNIKNTEINIDLDGAIPFPNKQKYINSVSLICAGHYNGFDFIDFSFEKNNESKIYDSDLALYHPTHPNPEYFIYSFGNDSIGNIYTLRLSFILDLLFTDALANVNMVVMLLDVDGNVVSTDDVFDLAPTAGTLEVKGTYNLNIIGIFPTENLYAVVQVNTSPTMVGTMFVDIRKQTEMLVLSDDLYYGIKWISSKGILDYVFNTGVTMPTAMTRNRITSGNSVLKDDTFLTLKPKEFVSDFCAMLGVVLNCKIDGSVEFAYISTFFNTILNVSNAIEITDFKDLSVKYSSELNFASVSVGKESNKYDLYTYLIDWNKILTFNQAGRKASENLDLTASKLRGDFSGILELLYKRSKNIVENNKDLFMFYYLFNEIETITDEDDQYFVYDNYTPRRTLTSWQKFLSFCFQNFGLNTLEISSNGGTVDNLGISGVLQMDDIVLNETPRLLPIKYEFTCLIDNLDFSESILKINHNGENVYLFVFNAETTDRFSEQKISGLKIQF